MTVPMDSSDRPVTLTEEQLNYMSEQTRRAVSAAVRRYVRSALVGFAILAGGIGFSLYASNQDADAGREAVVQSGQVIAVDGCNRDFVTISKVRGVFERSREFQESAMKRGDISKAQFARTTAYYDQQLKTFPLPDCRAARTILTDDPNAEIRVPQPRFPGDGR